MAGRRALPYGYEQGADAGPGRGQGRPRGFVRCPWTGRERKGALRLECDPLVGYAYMTGFGSVTGCPFAGIVDCCSVAASVSSRL